MEKLVKVRTAPRGLGRLLLGIHFPKKKSEILRYAEQHKSRVQNPDEAIEAIRTLDNRMYRSINDVLWSLGGLRKYRRFTHSFI